VRPAAALIVASLAAAVAVAPAATSEAARADWVGSDACGACHPGALAAWRASRHAAAAGNLGRSAADRRCLACHATGDAPAGRPREAAVGCEACHGAGAAYAADDIMRDPVLARELGLVELDTAPRRLAVCMRCHGTATRLRRFDPEAAWEAIRHP